MDVPVKVELLLTMAPGAVIIAALVSTSNIPANVMRRLKFVMLYRRGLSR